MRFRILVPLLCAAFVGCASGFGSRYGERQIDVIVQQDEITLKQLFELVEQKCGVRVVADTAIQSRLDEKVHKAFSANRTGREMLTTGLPADMVSEELADNNMIIVRLRPGAPVPPPAPAIPTVPSGLAATSGDARVSLTWTAVTGASTYNVKRSAASGGPFENVNTGLTAASFTDTGLTNGSTYFYVVSAVNTAGESGNSTSVEAKPTAPAPAADPVPPAPPPAPTPTLPAGTTAVTYYFAATGIASPAGTRKIFNLKDADGNYFPDAASLDACVQAGVRGVVDNSQSGAWLEARVKARFEHGDFCVLENGDVYVAVSFVQQYFGSRSGDSLLWEGPPRWNRNRLDMVVRSLPVEPAPAADPAPPPAPDPAAPADPAGADKSASKTKPASAPAAKPEVKPVAKPEAKPTEKKVEPKPEVKPADSEKDKAKKAEPEKPKSAPKLPADPKSAPSEKKPA